MLVIQRYTALARKRVMSETYKRLWTLADYDQLGWHDCRIYSIGFVDERFRLAIDIDYIFETRTEPDPERGFLVAPATVEFLDVSNLAIRIDSDDIIGATILDLSLSRSGVSPNGKVEMFRADISMDIGTVSFTTSGFEMSLKSDAVWLPTSDIGRD